MNLNIDGVLYLKITDPKKTSYGIEDPEFAISQLAQTTMRWIQNFENYLKITCFFLS